MPVYVFECNTCGRSFEKNLPMNSEHSGIQCPVGHHRVRRVFTAAPVFYHGSGFYITDQRAGFPNDKNRP